MRGKFVYEGGKFVPLVREVKARTEVITDEMEPLQHPADRKFYTSKKQYDLVTKMYGYEYLTHEDHDKIKPPDEVDTIDEDLLRAEATLEYGEGLPEDERAFVRQLEEKQRWIKENS